MGSRLSVETECFVPLNLVEYEQEVEDEEDSPLSALLSPLSGTVGSGVVSRSGQQTVSVHRGRG
jgi:hypothetical protein